MERSPLLMDYQYHAVFITIALQYSFRVGMVIPPEVLLSMRRVAILVKDLYDKNFKSLKKEIKEDLRRWKDLPCSWIGSSLISFFRDLKFLSYRSFTSLLRVTPRYFILNSSTNQKEQSANSSGITKNLGQQLFSWIKEPLVESPFKAFPHFLLYKLQCLWFMWSSLIHLDLTLVQGDRNGSIRILLHVKT